MTKSRSKDLKLFAASELKVADGSFADAVERVSSYRASRVPVTQSFRTVLLHCTITRDSSGLWQLLDKMTAVDWRSHLVVHIWLCGVRQTPCSDVLHVEAESLNAFTRPIEGRNEKGHVHFDGNKPW